MGGEAEFKESDLRIHKNNGEVHVHDDKTKTKFKMETDEFKEKYAKLREDTVKSKMGVLMDEDGIELHAHLKGNTVKFMVRDPIVGFEKFDEFIAELDAN